MPAGAQEQASSWNVALDELVFEGKVGSGSTAKVFRGTLKGMPVAVKELLPATSDAQGRVLQKAFARELEILSDLKHRNLVQLVGIVDVPACIVMEFCAGGTLFDLLHCSTVDVEWHQQVKMAADIAGAMEYLHGLKPHIIHRDLKSHNCMLSAPVTCDGVVPLVKVCDFGSARKWVRLQNLTKGCGTCHWMAPEVAMGTAYSAKADVFSYGMMLWEILSLEVPFEELPAHRASQRLMRGMRPSLEEEQFPPECPDKMIELVTRCWAHDPMDRPDFDQIQVSIGAISVAVCSQDTASTVEPTGYASEESFTSDFHGELLRDAGSDDVLLA